MKTYTIDCAKWRCGDDGPNRIGVGATLLLNNSGFMCCLGQMCRHDGISARDILQVSSPGNLNYAHRDKVPLLCKQSCTHSQTSFADSAMEINDDDTITTQERMQRLTELGKTVGVNIEFVNVPEEGEST